MVDVGSDGRIKSKRLGNDVALWVHARLALGQASLRDKLADKRVIGADAGEASLLHMIGTTVAEVDHRGPVVRRERVRPQPGRRRLDRRIV